MYASVSSGKPTALKEMEALSVLGVADKKSAIRFGAVEYTLHLAPRFDWFLTPECKALRWPDLTGKGGTA
jgi:hypothetical protein